MRQTIAEWEFLPAKILTIILSVVLIFFPFNWFTRLAALLIAISAVLTLSDGTENADDTFQQYQQTKRN